ncbi:DEAD/DEAH box helicase [Brevibacillus dissolubilis]|uniref:DEAD/DEAH box helicase n=1 Tax=Brevibacillus dissolubilis TaxID=1844116 RepID=UPI0011165F86|nr:DEAD/DEAH box helicase [Brevibacillus dissolubilis]
MNIVESVSQALRNPSSLQSTIAIFKEEIAWTEQSGGIRELQEQRCTVRFLTRAIQYSERLLGEADFLAALRDFILFVGSLQVPDNVANLVRKSGAEFDIYVEDPNNTVNARIKWIGDNERFIHQVYGQEPVELFNRKHSCGDTLLYRATGFKKYRSFEQKIAVHTALNMPQGYTLLVSLPTGAGKSLLTQMIAHAGEGLTIVIVPTVALGIDQYRAARTVLADSLMEDQIANYCGDVSATKAKLIINNINKGRLRLLIISPESLVRNDLLKQSLYQAAESQYLKHLVIDEAHIVEDWGALFRPDFQMMSVVRNEMLNLSSDSLKTLLLSATLTETAVNNLKSLMSDGERWIELRCDSLRTEPRYIIEKCKDQDELKLRILHLCKTLPKPMIIYEIKPEKAEWWKQLLKSEGFSNVATFTGDTNDSCRNEIIRDWSEDKLDIVVATSAFGMGIDKPDVRTVLHATLPESINRFYQEVGRGGRDGLPSLSVLCYSPSDDRSLQQYISSSRVLTVEKMVDRWVSMLRADSVERDGSTVLLDTSTPPSHFSEKERETSGSQNMRWNLNLLLFLIRWDYLDFVEMVFVPSQNRYYVRVSMCDPVLMQNEIELGRSLETHREKEVENVMSGYTAMTRLAKNERSSCCADHFVNLFPNAEPSCGGCSCHDYTYCKDGDFTFNHTIPEYIQDLSNSIKHSPSQLLIVRGETESWDVKKALELGAKLVVDGYKILVLPSTDNVDSTGFDGLVLDATEFEHLVFKHPSLFKGSGVICAFDDDQRRNQSQFRSMCRIDELGISSVYYCRENMFINQANRTIRHLLNASTLRFWEAMEVR